MHCIYFFRTTNAVGVDCYNKDDLQVYEHTQLKILCLNCSTYENIPAYISFKGV